MDDNGTNAILVVAMGALLLGMVYIGFTEFFRFQAVLSTQPVDVAHADVSTIVSKPVRMVLYTSSKPGLEAANGKLFACEQITLIHSHNTDRLFLPEQGLQLTDRQGKLKIACHQINLDFCTLIFKGRVTEGSNMLPKDIQDQNMRNALYVAGALPTDTRVTAIGVLHKTKDGFELVPIDVLFNQPMLPIVSTLSTDNVLSIWMNQILMPVILKGGLCLLGFFVAGLVYHARSIKMGTSYR